MTLEVAVVDDNDDDVLAASGGEKASIVDVGMEGGADEAMVAFLLEGCCDGEGIKARFFGCDCRTPLRGRGKLHVFTK